MSIVPRVLPEPEKQHGTHNKQVTYIHTQPHTSTQTCTLVLRVILYMLNKKQKQFKYLATGKCINMLLLTHTVNKKELIIILVKYDLVKKNQVTNDYILYNIAMRQKLQN